MNNIIFTQETDNPLDEGEYVFTAFSILLPPDVKEHFFYDFPLSLPINIAQVCIDSGLYELEVEENDNEGNREDDKEFILVYKGK